MICAKLPWRSWLFPNPGEPISCLQTRKLPPSKPSSAHEHTQILISYLHYTCSHVLPANTLIHNMAPNNPYTWLRGGPATNPQFELPLGSGNIYTVLKSISSASHFPSCFGEEEAALLNHSTEYQQSPCWIPPLLASAYTTSTNHLLVFHLHFAPSSVICALIISHYWRPCCNEF